MLGSALKRLADAYPLIAEVARPRAHAAIELCVPGTDGRLGGPEPWPAGATALMEATRAAGLLIGKGGLYGNVLRIAPPLSVTDDESRGCDRDHDGGRG